MSSTRTTTVDPCDLPMRLVSTLHPEKTTYDVVNKAVGYKASGAHLVDNPVMIAGSVITTIPTTRRMDTNGRDIGIDFSYYNRTGVRITIVDRTGIPMTLESEDVRGFNGARGVYIRKKYFFRSPDTISTVYENLTHLGDLHSSELNEFRNELYTKTNRAVWNTEITTEYLVTNEEISRGNGIVYFQAADVMISQNPKIRDVRHPYSPEYFNPKFPELAGYGRNILDFNFSIRYITNEENASPLFLPLFGQVFKITPQKGQPARALFRESNTHKEIADAPTYLEFLFPTNSFMPIEGDDTYRRIALTTNDAIKNMEIFSSRHEALQPIEAQTKIIREHSSEINELSEKNRKLEEELKMKEDEIRDLKRRRDIEKDLVNEMRDRESHSRKSTGDLLKIIGATVASILAIIPLLLKLFATPKPA